MPWYWPWSSKPRVPPEGFVRSVLAEVQAAVNEVNALRAEVTITVPGPSGEEATITTEVEAE